MWQHDSCITVPASAPHNESNMKAGLEKLMLELKAKIRRNEERLAADMAAPLLPPDDQVSMSCI
jgi:hypothetical protein